MDLAVWCTHKFVAKHTGEAQRRKVEGEGGEVRRGRVSEESMKARGSENKNEWGTVSGTEHIPLCATMNLPSRVRTQEANAPAERERERERERDLCSLRLRMRLLLFSL